MESRVLEPRLLPEGLELHPARVHVPVHALATPSVKCEGAEDLLHARRGEGLHRAIRAGRLRAPCLPKEIEIGHRHAEEGIDLVRKRLADAERDNQSIHFAGKSHRELWQ